MPPKNTISNINAFNSDLKIAKELVYDKCGFELKNHYLNIEGSEYGSCSFELNGHKIQFRVSKITPTKSGQFVTIWKRNLKGNIEPFDFTDDFHFFIITSRRGNNVGQFIFPKTVLVSKGVISHNNKEGKRGIRVYPPWDITNSTQAKKTQAWQIEYFLNFHLENSILINKTLKLFNK